MRCLFLLLLACPASCARSPREGPPRGDSPAGVPDGPADGADAGDAGPDTDAPPAPCPPRVERAARAAGPDTDAGRALAFVDAPAPSAALGLPDAGDGAGRVEVFGLDAVAWETPSAVLSADGARSLGRSLAPDPAGGLFVAALDADGAPWILRWDGDVAVAADLGAGPTWTTDGDGAGVSLTTGAVDGSGEAKLIVGLPRSGAAGSVWIHTPDRDRAADLSADAVVWTGERSQDFAGAVVSADGDLDGDGIGDLVVSAWGHDAGGTMTGRVYALAGPVEADGDLADADVVLDGETEWDMLGWSLAGGADFDGDGLPDIAIGAPGYDGPELGSGVVYLLPAPLQAGRSLADSSAMVIGMTGDARAGWSIAALPTEGPGLAVGAPGFSGAAGAVWLVPGPLEGAVPLEQDPMVTGADRAGAGSTLAVDPAPGVGCPGLLVGAPDGGVVSWWAVP